MNYPTPSLKPYFSWRLLLFTGNPRNTSPVLHRRIRANSPILSRSKSPLSRGEGSSHYKPITTNKLSHSTLSRPVFVCAPSPEREESEEGKVEAVTKKKEVEAEGELCSTSQESSEAGNVRMSLKDVRLPRHSDSLVRLHQHLVLLSMLLDSFAKYCILMKNTIWNGILLNIRCFNSCCTFGFTSGQTQTICQYQEQILLVYLWQGKWQRLLLNVYLGGRWLRHELELLAGVSCWANLQSLVEIFI